MSSQNNRPFYHIYIAIPVLLIVVGACVMTAAGALENMHYVSAINQVLEIVNLTRTVSADQKIAATPGEDIWADLAKLGRVPPQSSHPNPWNNDVRVVSVDNMAIRIESDVPTHDCRRMALYFLNQAQQFGLVEVEAQPFGDVIWGRIYPAPVTTHSHVVETSCGTIPYARLALVFKASM